MNEVEHPAHAPGAPIVTVIGDGQLARMMQTAAIELGCSLRLLAGSRDASAAQVCADVLLGDFRNLASVREAAAGSDAITFDHEHVPNEHLDELIAEGFNVQPQPEALIFAQDKLLMRKKLREVGAPVPPFAAIESVDDGLAFWDAVEGQVCLKARRGGYDGKGVWFPGQREELRELVSSLLEAGTPLMAEKKVALRGELSAMVARTPSGATQPWPVVASVQENGVCAQATAPAPGIDAELRRRAETLSIDIARELGVTGVLAVELFLSEDENGQADISINELAMRPHNTGHWTQDGCITSQFEQHIRAVLDLPLGATNTTAPYTVMANVLGAERDPSMPMADRVAKVMHVVPDAKIHLYGKQHRPGRKIGHVNACGEDLESVRRRAQAAAHFLRHAQWPEGFAPESL
ncbi:5-(carboxyamino)imidazole ribonucleotide synthase [Corynebacterium gerontici]|uniref:5-(carboxyamino)imidazole ribonucleotide synthase n=1 Tax=Corynebacterium gerontici TaxID=2079234 RepID=UPI000F4EB96A|nr:5-(carboxyamino)imidazole ribonucleotide synthase [Corynebacterium gerontici]